MQSSYNGVAKSFHWIIMILVLLMLYGGFTSESLPKEDRLGFFQTHAGLGLVILILMLARLVWRLSHPVPALPVGLPRWQQIASKATHHGLYALVILQPIFGLILATSSKFNLKAFGLLGLQIAPNETVHQVGETLHGINAWVITALIGLHVAAALYHHFILRDNVLKRMLPFVKA
ncbi:MAG: cytochrome b [Parvibaculum sp.]|nr:cytochrome b [Parvibaculum sp.]